MSEQILALAKILAGAKETETQLLTLLCAAAEIELAGRLQGMTAADCGGAFLCAAAYWAAAGLLGSRVEETASFSAGAVSVKARGAAETRAAAEELRAQALRLLRPYIGDEGFCFCGVQG